MSYEIVTDKDQIGPWVCSRTGGTYYGVDCTAIGMRKNGAICAGVLYDNYNKASIRMHVAGEGKWLTREFLRVCFDYPFRQLGVNKIIGLVSSQNIVAKKFDEHLGFMLECVIKDAAPKGDLLVLTMTREQCRWLSL